MPGSPTKVVTCHTSWPMAGEHVGWAAHTWSLCVLFLPFAEACCNLTFAPLRGARGSEAAPRAEGTAAHLPSQAGGTAARAAVVSSPPPAPCLDEQSMTWGLKSAAGKSLTWLFSLKGVRDHECDSAHISGPSVLLGKHLRALSLRQSRLTGTYVALCSAFLIQRILNCSNASV